MTGKQIYYAQGSLNDCLLAVISRAGSLKNTFISIVANDRSNYYGVVDDTYLTYDGANPEGNKMRLVLRANDHELQVFHDVFEALQGDLFDAPNPTIPPA